MVLLLLRDGTHVEVARSVDVIHKLGYLVCIDHSDEPLMTVPADDVVAYTRNDRVVEMLLTPSDQPSIEVPRATGPMHNGPRRYGRRRRRATMQT